MPRRRPSAVRTVRRLLRDLVTFARLGLTSGARLAAESLFLRKQLVLYQERHKKPRRPDCARHAVGADRLASRPHSGEARHAHPMASQEFQLFWRWKSRPR